VYEAAPEIRPLGVGINLLPHSTRELTELGLQERFLSQPHIRAILGHSSGAAQAG